MVAPLKTETTEVVDVMIGKEGADHVRIKVTLPPLDRHDVEGQVRDVAAQVEIRSGPFLVRLNPSFPSESLPHSPKMSRRSIRHFPVERR